MADKIQRIKSEKTRLSRLFVKINPKTKKAVSSLIDNAAFMAATLQELQEYINEHGVTDEYQNGANQFGIKKSPQVETYNTMIKNYASVVKQLTDLLPKAESGGGSDALIQFLKR